MVTSIRRIIRHTSTCLAILSLLISLPSAHSLGVPLVPQQQQRHQPQPRPVPVPGLAGDWAGAKAALRNPDCCVVSVPGLESHLRVLQKQLADQGPAELDLRARVRALLSSSSAHGDCLRVRRSVAGDHDNQNGNDNEHEDEDEDPCTAALVELAQGFASLADGPLALEGVCEDVFLRIVCASDYRARDPMYHTDKAPLRGYVTLRGVGTDYMTRPCSPLEYVTLRGLGKGVPVQSVRRANELEFIVMKGDYYDYPHEYESSPVASSGTATSTAAADSWLARVWKRTAACVHRSPPAAATGGRRVIVSLDLADGDDDREWYQANTKREWRNGLTQRKSRLVA
jgi:hypothetical protein